MSGVDRTLVALLPGRPPPMSAANRPLSNSETVARDHLREFLPGGRLLLPGYMIWRGPDGVAYLSLSNDCGFRPLVDGDDEAMSPDGWYCGVPRWSSSSGWHLWYGGEGWFYTPDAAAVPTDPETAYFQSPNSDIEYPPRRGRLVMHQAAGEGAATKTVRFVPRHVAAKTTAGLAGEWKDDDGNVVARVGNLHMTLSYSRGDERDSFELHRASASEMRDDEGRCPFVVRLSGETLVVTGLGGRWSADRPTLADAGEWPLQKEASGEGDEDEVTLALQLLPPEERAFALKLDPYSPTLVGDVRIWH